MKNRPPESAASRMAQGVNRTSAWKGRVAETAVLMRLVLRGYNPYRPIFDGHQTDWAIHLTDGRLVTIQVKWAAPSQRWGRPTIQLRRWNGRRSQLYQDGEVNFVAGYDLWEDIVYVFSWDEVRGKTYISTRPDAAERWDKILSG